MKDPESGSPAPTDGAFGSVTIAALQKFLEERQPSPHFYVSATGEVIQLVSTTEKKPPGFKLVEAWDDMTPREQAMHLYVDHGFDSAYFYSYFDGWGDDRPDVKYEMGSMSGVLRYFVEHEGAEGRQQWHDDDHDDHENGENEYGGGPTPHAHEMSTKIPQDVIESLDDAFHRDGK